MFLGHLCLLPHLLIGFFFGLWLLDLSPLCILLTTCWRVTTNAFFPSRRLSFLSVVSVLIKLVPSMQHHWLILISWSAPVLFQKGWPEPPVWIIYPKLACTSFKTLGLTLRSILSLLFFFQQWEVWIWFWASAQGNPVSPAELVFTRLHYWLLCWGWDARGYSGSFLGALLYPWSASLFRRQHHAVHVTTFPWCGDASSFALLLWLIGILGAFKRILGIFLIPLKKSCCCLGGKCNESVDFFC